jgi:hypothetical protein
MTEEARVRVFVVAAIVVLTAAIGLTTLRRGGPPAARTEATPAPAPAASPVASGEAGGAPVPPAARATARAYARRLARRAGARLVGVAVADDPATTELEMSATAWRGDVRTTWILVLTAERGSWTVSDHR